MSKRKPTAKSDAVRSKGDSAYADPEGAPEIDDHVAIDPKVKDLTHRGSDSPSSPINSQVTPDESGGLSPASIEDLPEDDPRLRAMSKLLRPSREVLLRLVEESQIPADWWDEESPF